MKTYRLFVLEQPEMQVAIRFDCEADNAAHAVEQAENAYPGCEVLSLTVADDRPHLVGPILQETGYGDYEMNPALSTQDFWLSIANGSLWIKQKKDHMTIEVYPRGGEASDPLHSTDFEYKDLRPSESEMETFDDAQRAAHERFAPTSMD